jgi:hypothetical protein
MAAAVAGGVASLLGLAETLVDKDIDLQRQGRQTRGTGSGTGSLPICNSSVPVGGGRDPQTVGRFDRFTAMSMDSKSAAPSLDAEITAARDTILQGTYTIIAVNNNQRRTDELLEALKSNRTRLQGLKVDYAKAVQESGGVQKAVSSKRRAIFHEIMRMYGAMEGLKNELTQRGANFDLDVNDHEHPNAAFKRLTAPVKKPISFGVMHLYLLISIAALSLWFFTSDIWREMSHFGQQRSSSVRPGR